MTPIQTLTRTSNLLTRAAWILAIGLTIPACGSKSNDSNNNEPQVLKPEEEQVLKVKSAAVKKVMVGKVVNLHDYLLNSENATFEIIEGRDRVAWEDPFLSKLRFNYGGTVVVQVTDETGTVFIRMIGMFDTTGLTDGPDIANPPVLEPVDPGLHL